VTNNTRHFNRIAGLTLDNWFVWPTHQRDPRPRSEHAAWEEADL